MEIFEKENDLVTLFNSLENRKIKIVSAFAGGTESIVKKLVECNDVELIFGTINSFISPKYIESLIDLESKNLNVFMDFRYGNSTHWKLYLIDPDIVIVGSANFTSIGVSLKRDTLVRINSEELYIKYSSKVEKLKSAPLVLSTQSDRFDELFDSYKEKFVESQIAQQSGKNKTDIHGWLADENNQALPLFIWDNEIEQEIYSKAFDLIVENEAEIESKDNYRLLTFSSKPSELPFKEGSLVITMNEKGAHAQFERINRVIYKDGIHYLYSFKGKRKHAPFDIEEIKSGLKSIAAELYDRERTVIYREDIEAILLKSC